MVMVCLWEASRLCHRGGHNGTRDDKKKKRREENMNRLIFGFLIIEWIKEANSNPGAGCTLPVTKFRASGHE